MAGRVLGEKQVRVNVRGAGKWGEALKYLRNLAGMTLADAIKALDSGDPKQGGLPQDMETTFPYYLNGREIEDARHSTIVLQRGDSISTYDP